MSFGYEISQFVTFTFAEVDAKRDTQEVENFIWNGSCSRDANPRSATEQVLNFSE